MSEFNINRFVFLTLFTYRQRKVFITDTINKILCDTISFHNEKDNVCVAGFVILPDHVHLLLEPRQWTISKFVNNFKSYTGQKVKTDNDFSNKVWRSRFFADAVWSQDDFINRLKTIHNNPVGEGLAASSAEYPWSSYSCYYGGDQAARVFVPPLSCPIPGVIAL